MMMFSFERRIQPQRERQSVAELQPPVGGQRILVTVVAHELRQRPEFIYGSSTVKLARTCSSRRQVARLPRHRFVHRHGQRI